MGNRVNESRIKILDESIANRIAAGEVVERPASVVKELVENSIDADASEILIAVEAGGNDSIQVCDNGIGMSREDIELALRRHATSKISRAEDLHHINTLGFRGEALPSIASVSRMEIISRLSDEDLGARLVIDQGRVVESSEAGAPYGTCMTVKELFFNTPARRKFLKAAVTEFGHVADVVERIAIAYPRIKFELKHGDKVHYSLPHANTYKDRIVSVWGEDRVEEMVEVEAGDPGIAVFGFAAPPTATQSSARMIQFILNGRPIKNSSLLAAVKRAYEGTLPPGKYPQIVLFLEMDPELVDVNVHPMKLEVRLRRSSEVFRTVVRAIQSGFSSRDTADRFAPTSKKTRIEDFAFRGDTGIQNGFDFEYAEKRSEYPIESPSARISESEIYSTPSFSNSQDIVEKILPTFWQIHDSYILAETKGGIIIIDQHAAHERILFEEIRTKIKRKKITGQRLLFPVAVKLTAMQESYFAENKPMLERIGFEFGPMAAGHILVEAIPAEIKHFGKGDVLVEILDDLAEGKSELTALEEFAKMVACKMAIKAGDPLSSEEMSFLFDRLFSTEKPYTCPHGRPTIIKITLDELEKRFERK